MRFTSSFSVFVLACLVPLAARADPPSRAGRALWLEGELPGVWISSRALYTPLDASAALSVCAEPGCAPVGERRTCAPPECPGHGTLLVVARDVALVPPFPRDYGGYTRELDALRNDPRLASLAPHLVTHPEHAAREEQASRAREAQSREESRYRESVRWVSGHRHRERLELSLLGSIATLAEAGGSYAGVTATGSFGFLLRERDANEDDDKDALLLGILVGDVLGAELRAHWLQRLDASQEAAWMVAVGVGPLLANRFERSVVRLPTMMGVLMPEVGAIFRADRDPTWYVGWSAPFSFLVTHDVAIDVTPRVLVVDEWIPKPHPDAEDDPAEVVFMLSAGLRLP